MIENKKYTSLIQQEISESENLPKANFEKLYEIPKEFRSYDFPEENHIKIPMDFN